MRNDNSNKARQMKNVYLLCNFLLKEVINRPVLRTNAPKSCLLFKFSIVSDHKKNKPLTCETMLSFYSICAMQDNNISISVLKTFFLIIIISYVICLSIVSFF